MAKLFSKVVTTLYSSLAATYELNCLAPCQLLKSHSSKYEVVPHYTFNLHFPED